MNVARPRLLIDCDPGHDDAIALVLANHFAEIVGITTVGGNAPLLDVTRNALITAQIFEIDAEVHAGCAKPLVGEPRFALEVHGESGFDGPTLPPLTRSAASDDAVGFLVEKIRSTEGLWLVTLGPLTNIATALQAAPDLAGRLAGISFMGGSAEIGNVTPVAEFNISTDPEAASIVLSCGANLLMAGLGLTRQFPVEDSFIDKVRRIGTVGSEVLADSMLSYLDAIELVSGERRGGLHDPCAVLAVTHPALISHRMRHVAVETAGEITRGMTVVDRRPKSGGIENVAHAYSLDAVGAQEAVLLALAP